MNEEPVFPQTVDDAVQFVLSRLSPAMLDFLRNFNGDEVGLRVELAKRMIPGMSVRSLLGLWTKNTELLAQLPRQFRHPDDASSFFLVKCWKHLRNRDV